MAKEIQYLVDTDIKEKVEGEPTPCISPIVTPPKKDGEEIRLCVDMREANRAVKRERHTIPTIDELILDLNDAKVFSKLDLRSGYHQLELHPDSRYITTFSTQLMIYRYKRLTGARNIFDDVVIIEENTEYHDAALKEVFQDFQIVDLLLMVKVCVQNKQDFFSRDGISPHPAKVKAVREFRHPQNVKDLRSFLGMTNYCSRFIECYAKICRPLRELTHKVKPWKLT